VAELSACFTDEIVYVANNSVRVDVGGGVNEVRVCVCGGFNLA